ncbi:hypothetical protein [Acinetobacter radioresistens]|uniref:hypothetical protein n=1 Tax=Acinetobacter radioresistens TaxID=40216 RepID=UPI0018C4291E|nr:hypothetical protein [Acinetobacter radioresistens]MBA5697577.1 hypothetical protein [Acinetobacter radioresistens]
MDNYKIKVKDEAVFAEVVALCEQISGKSFPYPNISCDPDLWIFIGPEGAFGWSLDLDHSWSGLDLKELTLPKLRDIIVLKRNDVKDANCIDKKREAWYLASDGTYYAWQYRKLCWDTESDACVEAHDIKPINQPQAPALISGAEALRALADGKEVEGFSEENEEWIPIVYFSVQEVVNGLYKFRLKPQTIKLELELPKPFEPKMGDIYWFLSPFYSTGYDHCTFANDSSDKLHVQYGAYRSEDDVKKAVEQLRKIRGAS